VAIIQDRYQGCYSSGGWLAISRADELIDGEARASWALGNGPSGSDIEAAEFWADPPSWIVAGETPDRALSELEARESVG
jgi:hypothetical protein